MVTIKERRVPRTTVIFVALLVPASRFAVVVIDFVVVIDLAVVVVVTIIGVVFAAVAVGRIVTECSCLQLRLWCTREKRKRGGRGKGEEVSQSRVTERNS